MEELDPSFQISFAQNREDIILDYFFQDVSQGFYVDVGAGHPAEDSVTKLFYDKGWTGINIEPIKRVYKLLQKNRPRDINLNIGLADKKGKLSFREYDNYGLSTFAAVMKREYEGALSSGSEKYQDYEVPVDTLANVLKTHKVKRVHFLKIDVEGLEYAVLAGNDWRAYRPEVLCIEANHILRDWRPLLKTNGYSKVFNDGINDYYASNESGRGDNFSYEKVFLSGKRPIDYRIARAVNKAIKAADSEIYCRALQVWDLAEKIDERDYRLNALAGELAQYRRPRFWLKALLATRVNRAVEERIYPSSLRNKLSLPPRSAGPAILNDVNKQLDAIYEYDDTQLAKIKPRAYPVRALALALYRQALRLTVRLVRALRLPRPAILKIIRGTK